MSDLEVSASGFDQDRLTVLSSDLPEHAEHSGSAKVKWFVPLEAMREQTAGSYLGLVSHFAVAPGSVLQAHVHPTHEFWFVTDGAGIVQTSAEAIEIGVGDLVYTPPNVAHQLRVLGDVTFKAFGFCLSYPEHGSAHTDVESFVSS